MYKIQSLKYKGVTFVELMVVISIIGIMTGVGFVSLKSSRNDSRLRAAQREVASTIKLAQSYALQGKMQGAVTPCGYGFKFTSAADYQIFYKLPTGGNCDVPGDATNAESFTLSNAVVLDGPANVSNTEIYFTVPFSAMTGPISSIFTFQYPAGSGDTKTITINLGGNVIEN